MFVSGCFVGLLAAWPQVARGQNFYLTADAGVALAQDVSIDRFLVPTRGAKVELDPGVRLSVAGGYNFNNYIGAQIETGIIYNEVDRVQHGGSMDASLGHVPLLADIVLRCDRPESKWVHYLGAGLGGDVSIISVDHVRAPNGVIVDGDGSTVVFAWQAFTGVRYKLAENLSVGGAYKFFWADGASWDVRNARGDIESDTAGVHSFLVDFTFTF